VGLYMVWDLVTGRLFAVDGTFMSRLTGPGITKYHDHALQAREVDFLGWAASDGQTEIGRDDKVCQVVICSVILWDGQVSGEDGV
jgi:hypothetical protein